MLTRNTTLSKNIIQFCRLLRQHNFGVSVPEETTALQALALIEYDKKDVYRLALKAVLCRSHTQLDAFDSLFNEYWKEMAEAVGSSTTLFATIR